MLNLFGAKPAQNKGTADITETTTNDFVRDVLERSNQKIVLVDFWAPWCEPCLALRPILEKMVAQRRDQVALVTLDIEQHPAIAQQMRIQSIPAVFAFSKGRPIDGFMGALSEKEIDAFITKCVGEAPADPVKQLAEEAAAIFADNPDRTYRLYERLAEIEPGHAESCMALARRALASGDIDGGERIISPAQLANPQDQAIAAIQSGIEMMRQAKTTIDQSDPLSIAYADAKTLIASGHFSKAITALLDIIAADRDWNNQCARKDLLCLFGLLGPTDAITITARKRLSSLLFS